MFEAKDVTKSFRSGDSAVTAVKGVTIADEPAGNLDTQTSATIVELLRDLSHSEGTTVVLVTHDASIADQADRLLRLDDGQLALST